MKLTEKKLKQIILEELNNMNSTEPSPEAEAGEE